MQDSEEHQITVRLATRCVRLALHRVLQSVFLARPMLKYPVLRVCAVQDTEGLPPAVSNAIRNAPLVQSPIRLIV